MINIQNIDKQPTLKDFAEYIGNPTFERLYGYLLDEYKAITYIEYSKDVWQRGWNIKFKKSGKSLCVVYPKQGYYTVLTVIGKKEKEAFDELLPVLSKEIREIYFAAKEGNGQRWLMIDIFTENSLYSDLLKIIKIRRESK